MDENKRKEYLTQFGSRVKELRKLRGMTQLELAVKAGYTDGANPSALPSEVIDILGHGEPDQRVIPVYPSTITSDFINLRNSLGLKCRFHDMRHYYVSLAHSMGIPDRVIQDRGGFSTDKTLKAVYRNSVKEDEEVYNELWNEYMMKKLAID